MVINLNVEGHEVLAALADNAILDKEDESDLDTPRSKVKMLRITDDFDEDDAPIWIMGSVDGNTFSVCLDISIDGQEYTEEEFLKKLQVNGDFHLRQEH